MKFWRALAGHWSKRDPEMVFLETINEPMVEDPYRWFGIQAKLIAAMRADAPKHTIIASGHRWSGLAEMLAPSPTAIRMSFTIFTITIRFPLRIQGATWAGPNLQFYSKVPYPSSPESVAKILDPIADQPAPRLSLVPYGQDRWNAERIDRDISMAAGGAKHHVPVTCNEFGAYRRILSNPEDRARAGLPTCAPCSSGMALAGPCGLCRWLRSAIKPVAMRRLIQRP